MRRGKSNEIMLASIFILIAVPAYAAMTDQQKAELDALNKQIVEL